MGVLSDVLGLGEGGDGVVQMALRAVVIYAVALAFVRVGEKRFLGKNTAFDVILGIMFGSVITRAITSPEDFLPIVVAAGVLVLLHWLSAVVAFRSDSIGSLFKGNERPLVIDGEIQWDEMRSSNITRRDLLGALRSNARTDDLSRVQVARLERSGEISVIEAEREPQAVTLAVADGVQSVRIELSS